MKTEQDVRKIYEGFYKLAEEVGSSSYTESISWQLHCMLTNPGIVDTEKKIKAFGLARKIDTEYYPKFEALKTQQRRLEAQIK